MASNGLALDLDSVSYSYPQSQKVALSEISYTFPTGTTAIVGPNGAGKSTLVKLLTGLLAPTAGSISVLLPGGTCLPPDQAHRAVLFQEPSHLYLTIRQNVTMRFERTPTEDARILEALEIAGLRGVVQGLPDGIDTLVGAGFGGRLDLSGGQWQRLALARLIYQDAPVMILDEPVASLDPEGERAVFELFAHVNQAKVILFTTHRYDSIPTGTKIVVLVDGRIAETGTHEELLQRQRHYWSLYMAGGPTAGYARGWETVPTTPDKSLRRLDNSSAKRPRKSQPTPPAEDKTCSPRGRRFGTGLVYLDQPDAAVALHNRGQGGLSSNGHDPGNMEAKLVPLHIQLAEGRRRCAADDVGDTLVGRAGEPVVGPSEADAWPVPDGNGMGDVSQFPALRRVQDGVNGRNMQPPEGQYDPSSRVALLSPRRELRKVRSCEEGDDVR